MDVSVENWAQNDRAGLRVYVSSYAYCKEIENVKVRWSICACTKTWMRWQNQSHEKSKLQATRSMHQRQNKIYNDDNNNKWKRVNW